MSITILNDSREDRDAATADALLERGHATRVNLLDAHQRAWSSDTITAMIHALDLRDLVCVSVVAQIGASAGDETDQWLLVLCDAESDRRAAAVPAQAAA